MQRLYAFWPSLEVDVLNENEPEKNNEEEHREEGQTAIHGEQQRAAGGDSSSRSSRPHTPRGKSPGSARIGSVSVECRGITVTVCGGGSDDRSSLLRAVSLAGSTQDEQDL